MEQEDIVQSIIETFAGVDVVIGQEGIGTGDTFFFYDPERSLDPRRRFPFATIVTKDYGEFDCASQLDRPGVFRLNLGVSQATFESLFGPRPGAHDDANAPRPMPGYDYTALDQLLPHPVYAPQSWICVLNPSAETFHGLQPLLTEAYDRAVRRFRGAGDSPQSGPR